MKNRDPSFEYCDWHEFKTSLSRQFKIQNIEQIARDKLYYLKQNGSVMRYNEIFNKLIMQIPDIGEKDALDKYKRGLRIDLQFEVARSKPKSVDEAQAVALECDQMLMKSKFTLLNSIVNILILSSEGIIIIIIIAVFHELLITARE